MVANEEWCINFKTHRLVCSRWELKQDRNPIYKNKNLHHLNTNYLDTSMTAQIFSLRERERELEVTRAALQFLVDNELEHLADKCGPIFKIRIGVNHALVVSNSDIVKECFTTNDKAFASRPTSTASKILGYDYVVFGMAPYGQYWVELRKIAMSELLSNRRLELLKHVRNSEIDTSIQELYKVWKNHDKAKGPVLVDMRQWFGDLTLNVILRMIAGKRYSGSMSSCDETEARTCQKGMRDFLRLLGLFIIEDALPYLSCLDLQGYKKRDEEHSKRT
ncbi:hypothetical protein IFM89_039563 [Coptis chinensis]|uniref:Cytochrome P450 n=1 Tax=Coptis chinensis TaxID=261450 RepID=A0A835GTV8_9MAGN|nr:hypothetical protein IFM89_039563 [Coptis chinensis]